MVELKSNKQNYLIITLLVFIFLLISCSWATFNSNYKNNNSVWYQYEPTEVYLTGILEFKKAYGPPNYGADPAHDQKVSYYVLMLNSPINIKGDPSSELNSETVMNVKEIQIVDEDFDQLDQIYKSKNRKISIKGTLYKGTTGHHYTDVLINVKGLRKLI